MTKQKSRDKNLQNVVQDLAVEPVNAHNAQQLNQDVTDRRKHYYKKEYMVEDDNG